MVGHYYYNIIIVSFFVRLAYAYSYIDTYIITNLQST